MADIPSLSGVVYATARMFGVMVALPLGDSVPVIPRLILAVILGCSLASTPADFPELVLLSLAWEVVVGFLLGAPFRFVVDLSEMVGELIDTTRGQTISAILDPLNGQGSSDLATLLRYSSCALALHVGALPAVWALVGRSYALLPVGGQSFAVDAQGGILLEDMISLGISVVQACLVWVVSFVMVDLVAAAGAKMCNGLSFSTVAGIIKLVVVVMMGYLLVAQGGCSRLTVHGLGGMGAFGFMERHAPPIRG